MCGIFAVFGFAESPESFRQIAAKCSKKYYQANQRVRHRGPDWSGMKQHNNNILCHERLSIVGVQSGAQPLTTEDEAVILSVNGEIYNYRALKATLDHKYKFKTDSDCEVILYLVPHHLTQWLEHGPKLVHMLHGMFSFVLYDTKKDVYFVARDHVGITTLYQGWRKDGSVWFASEMKSLNEHCEKIVSFPPGSYYSSETKETVVYYNPVWYGDVAKNLPALADEQKKLTEEEEKDMHAAVRTSLEKSVAKRLMSEVPYGVLLSGGLDSSLIASIAMRMRKSIDMDATAKSNP